MVRNIISGPLDADKLDYLLRDSYFCGVKYGIYDMERLIGTLEKYEESSGDVNLAANYDGLYAIEQYVLAKYHLTMQVYRHKIRLITDAMIVRALELGIEKDELKWLKELYAYDGSNDYIKNFIKWDDYRVINKLLFSRDSNKWQSAEIFRRLRERRLFKRVFSSVLSPREIDRPRDRDFLSNIMDELKFRKKMEEKISEELSSTLDQDVNSDHVIIFSFTIKSVREQSKNDEGSIIIMKDDEPKKFENESALFNLIDEKQKEQYLEVYAPVDIREDEKKKKIKELYDKIKTLFVKEALVERQKRRKKKVSPKKSSKSKSKLKRRQK